MPVRFNLPLLGSCEQRLFRDDQSSDTLYHYTSIPAFMSIVKNRRLHMSDIRYMNDASEISYGLDLIKEAETLLEAGKKDDAPAVVLTNIMVRLGGTYVGCFSTHGSRLSQWRGYCESGQGVSIGFRADALRKVADTQKFALGRCVYDVDEQGVIVWQILAAVGIAADANDADAQEIEIAAYPNDADVPPPVGDSAEVDERDRRLMGSLPRIVALLKNPHFREEDEWRLVSHFELIVDDQETQYRPGKSMVIPYWSFKLPERTDGSLDIDHIWIGPTAHPKLAEESMTRFLESQKAKPTRGISYCGIPLREL